MTGKDGDTPNGAPAAAHYIGSLAQELAELAKTHELEASELIRGLHFAFAFRLAANLHCRVGAAPSRKRRQRRQGRAGAAVMIDQGSKRARTDGLAADQSKPIEPLLVAEAKALII
jgi:hypothetical protein